VKANQGAAGVDGQSIVDFEDDLSNNLYELWNRLSSGSYFPPPVRRVDIPKANGGTRPLGIPIQHSSIPFQTSIQGQTSNMNLPFQRDQLANQLKTIDATNVSIDILERQYQLSLEQTKLTQDSAAKSQELLETTEELRDNIANFDDQFRPLRNYFYWEPHCFDIPLCAATRSLFDALDGIDQVTDKTGAVQVNTDKLADLAPKLTALLPQTIASMKISRDLSQATYNSQKALYDQQQATNDTALAMGQSFDQAKNNDLFYLPPEAFQNPDFKRGLTMFLSPDGKSARMFITHETDPATPEGIARVDSERKAAQDGLKMSSLSDAKVFLGGTAATYKDMADGAKYDLLIAVVAALTLIFMIMLILTRSAVAALVIVATAASSIAASFGISVLLWQDLFGIQVHWLVMLMSVIILLAVGSDYNLLLVSRFRDEIHAGLKTGEDGPTHADPQSLQLLQDNFPPGTMITLTPWDPQEIWFLVSAALAKRPAVIAPFVTRPPETVLDRAAHGLPSAALAAQGVYCLRCVHGRSEATIVLQGTGVTNVFVNETLPMIDHSGLGVNVYVVTSTELFDLLPSAERDRIFPELHQREAMGITDFTMATMTRWIRSDLGRTHSLHPFRHGHFLGSGSGAMVMKEAGLDGQSQFEAILAFVRARNPQRF
jgi:hypothetical protein